MSLDKKVRHPARLVMYGFWLLALGLWGCMDRGPLPPNAPAWEAAQIGWDHGDWEQVLERLSSIRPDASPYGPLAHTWRIVIAAGLADGYSRVGNQDRARHYGEIFSRETASYTVPDLVILPFGFPKISGDEKKGVDEPEAEPGRQVDLAILRAVLDAAGVPGDRRAALGKFRVREVSVPRDQFERFLDRYRK